MNDIRNKKNKHIICNLLLIGTLLSAIANFIIIILFKNNKDLLINTISSILLCIFVIFFILASITNTKKNKSPIVLSSIVLIIFNIIHISYNLNLLSNLELKHVPDFTNKSLIEVIKWSEKNKIKINQIYEYSDTIDEYKIIGQDKKENILIKDTNKLTVSVSEGPNPDKEIILPNMETWSSDKVIKFIKNNFLNNVKIEFIISDKEKDTVIEQSKSGTIKRSDELKLIFSLGDSELEDVKLIDLRNKTLFEAEFYLKRNAIKYDIERNFSSKITRNNIIGTNKKTGVMLKPNSDEDKLILNVSKGKKIKVPDLKKYNMLEITEWVIKNKLRLEFINKYDDSIKLNKVIELNYNKGDIVEEKSLIKVTISKGKLVMLSFESLEEFKDWANKYNINYEEKFEFNNSIEEGKVINYSHKTGDTIKNDDTVIVTISQGKKTAVPNVIGKTKNEAIKKLEEAKLKYNIVYDNSNDDKNKVIKQSLVGGSEVAQNSTVTLTLSNGKKPIKNNSNSNKNNQQNNENNPSQEICDKSKTITVSIQGALNGGSLSETAANYRRAYPNIKFSFVGKPNNEGSNGMVHPESTSKRSFEANYCDTYTIYIIQN